MSRVNVSIAMKIGYQHAVLTEDGDVLAECGIWHAHEDDECAVADGWVLVSGNGPVVDDDPVELCPCGCGALRFVPDHLRTHPMPKEVLDVGPDTVHAWEGGIEFEATDAEAEAFFDDLAEWVHEKERVTDPSVHMKRAWPEAVPSASRELNSTDAAMVERCIYDVLFYTDPSGRLVFAWADDRFVLTQDEANQTARKVREFLQKCGWLPAAPSQSEAGS